MKEIKKMKKWQIASALVVGAVVVVGGVMMSSGVGTQGMLIRRGGSPVFKNQAVLKEKSPVINEQVRIIVNEVPRRATDYTTNTAKNNTSNVKLATKGELSKGEFSNLIVKALKVDASKNIGCADDLKGSSYEQSACYLVDNKIMNLDNNGQFNSGEMVSKKEFSSKMVKVFQDPQCPWCSISKNNKDLMKDLTIYATEELYNSSTAIDSEKASIIVGSVINGLDSKGVKVCCLNK